MKMFEGVVREADGNEKKVRVMANDAYEARKLLQQWHGVRQVPYLPKIVPS
jgi:glutaredoxin